MGTQTCRYRRWQKLCSGRSTASAKLHSNRFWLLRSWAGSPKHQSGERKSGRPPRRHRQRKRWLHEGVESVSCYPKPTRLPLGQWFAATRSRCPDNQRIETAVPSDSRRLEAFLERWKPRTPAAAPNGAEQGNSCRLVSSADGDISDRSRDHYRRDVILPAFLDSSEFAGQRLEPGWNRILQASLKAVRAQTFVP